MPSKEYRVLNPRGRPKGRAYVKHHDGSKHPVPLGSDGKPDHSQCVIDEWHEGAVFHPPAGMDPAWLLDGGFIEEVDDGTREGNAERDVPSVRSRTGRSRRVAEAEAPNLPAGEEEVGDD